MIETVTAWDEMLASLLEIIGCHVQVDVVTIARLASVASGTLQAAADLNEIQTDPAEELLVGLDTGTLLFFPRSRFLCSHTRGTSLFLDFDDCAITFTVIGVPIEEN